MFISEPAYPEISLVWECLQHNCNDRDKACARSSECELSRVRYQPVWYSQQVVTGIVSCGRQQAIDFRIASFEKKNLTKNNKLTANSCQPLSWNFCSFEKFLALSKKQLVWSSSSKMSLVAVRLSTWNNFVHFEEIFTEFKVDWLKIRYV